MIRSMEVPSGNGFHKHKRCTLKKLESKFNSLLDRIINYLESRDKPTHRSNTVKELVCPPLEVMGQPPCSLQTDAQTSRQRPPSGYSKTTDRSVHAVFGGGHMLDTDQHMPRYSPRTGEFHHQADQNIPYTRTTPVPDVEDDHSSISLPYVTTSTSGSFQGHAGHPLSFTTHPVKHTILRTPMGPHYRPVSLKSPLACLQWSPSPIILSHLALSGSTLDNNLMRLLIDTGAERCTISADSIPPFVPIYHVHPHNLNGIGGSHIVRRQAWLDLLVPGRDLQSSETVNVPVSFLADVIEPPVIGMSGADVLLGTPALLPFAAEVKLGGRSRESAKLILNVPGQEIQWLSQQRSSSEDLTERLHKPTAHPAIGGPERFVPFRRVISEDTSPKQALPYPHLETSDWHGDLQSRRVAIPIAFPRVCNTGGPGPVLWEDWYDEQKMLVQCWNDNV